MKAFDLVTPPSPADKQLLDAGRLVYQSLLDTSLRPRALQVLNALRHATASPYSQGDLLQLYLALEEKQTALEMLAPICAAGPVACNDLAINPMYAPLRGDVRFEKLAQKYTTLTLK